MTPFSREPLSLTTELFDVLVIGGGINGAAVAWDTAMRGLKTVLVERADFGGAASAGCFKIAHGGLRYLQHCDIARLKESVEEQRLLRRSAPHLIHPLPFLIPCYGWGMKSKAALRFALSFYEKLVKDRNHGVDSYHILGRHQVLSPEQCLKIAPALDVRGLSGGVVYYDCQMSNCERLTLSVVLSACAAGAKACNYLEAVRFVKSEAPNAREQIDSVIVRDRLDQREFRIRAKVVVNAGGPWTKVVRSLAYEQGDSRKDEFLRSIVHSKGIQLVSRQFVKGYALAVQSRYRDPDAVVSRGSRSYFFHPWRGHSLLGTTDSIYRGDPSAFSISMEEIRGFLEEVKLCYPDNKLVPVNIQYAFGHLRPLDKKFERGLQGSDGAASGESKVARRDEIVDHASLMPVAEVEALENLVSVVGAKYTTFRALGEKVGNLVSKKLFGSVKPSKTAEAQLVGGEIDDWTAFTASQLDRAPQYSQSMIRHLAANYGTQMEELLAILAQSAEFSLPLSKGNEVIAAEVVYACRHEMAVRLEDVLLRRTGLGTLGFPGEGAVRKAGEIMALELGWDRGKLEDEVQNALRLFNFS
jgi:glycerol-3-phosphate dehydrogenase